MKPFYQFLFNIVNGLSPKIHQKDLNHLTSFQKTVVAIKYWLTIKIID